MINSLFGYPFITKQQDQNSSTKHFRVLHINNQQDVRQVEERGEEGASFAKH